MATPSPQDVQAKIAAAQAELLKTTSAGVKLNADPAKWPPGHWKNAWSLLTAASAEAGQLVAPAPLTAAFRVS